MPQYPFPSFLRRDTREDINWSHVVGFCAEKEEDFFGGRTVPHVELEDSIQEQVDVNIDPAVSKFGGASEKRAFDGIVFTLLKLYQVVRVEESSPPSNEFEEDASQRPDVTWLSRLAYFKGIDGNKLRSAIAIRSSTKHRGVRLSG